MYQMLRRLKNKGALFVEYAMALAFIIVVGLVFLSSDGISNSIASIFGKAGNTLEIAANGGIDYEDINRRNMNFAVYISKLSTDLGINRSGANRLQGDTGPRDSDYGSKEMTGICTNNADNLNGGGWTFVNYIDTTTNEWVRDVYIYNKEKNNNLALKDYTTDTEVVTDLYRINYGVNGEAKNNPTITHIETPEIKTKVYVGKHASGFTEDNRVTYNVIRNADTYKKNYSYYEK